MAAACSPPIIVLSQLRAACIDLKYKKPTKSRVQPLSLSIFLWHMFLFIIAAVVLGSAVAVKACKGNQPGSKLQRLKSRLTQRSIKIQKRLAKRSHKIQRKLAKKSLKLQKKFPQCQFLRCPFESSNQTPSNSQLPPPLASMPREQSESLPIAKHQAKIPNELPPSYEAAVMNPATMKEKR
ncbi:hypothetical protein K493DRAFT_296415 [Basidiobolus meristosporus CBS 931.73]|uniref:Uncharacterized protein n=1 Tax=Basidiobolus meristosporus CBS 931.73 TaxID=1314790 RepID=A0A1Y1Z6B6_9FUNG|nr:hypothetical protein K493DRAFT_296415 [Basidiobolus meristosporus CBS 931.73]|eukprot:ORY05664.1 hypothetical protein K493DRAFT_296415 [Basidiobolus meristosporus CBS 931.73]